MRSQGKAASTTSLPEVFGILHRYFAGDGALLRLAQAMLEHAHLGAEVYPTTIEDAAWLWQFVPPGLARHMVHLPRHWDVLSATDRDQVVAFARALAGRVRGYVFHDRADWPERGAALATAAAELDAQLADIAGQPMLFFEYAAGIDLDAFARVLDRLVPLRQIGTCIDTGHVTVFSAHRWFSARHPGLDAWKLDPFDASLGALAGDFDEAAHRATDGLLDLVDRAAALAKPMHFHLHDGHLLSRLSRYGVRDHLPFGERVPVTTALAADGTLPAMLGRAGLQRLFSTVRAHLSAVDVSLTAEIHPHLRMPPKPLDEWAGWFSHWTDPSNAELTRGWLDQVADQAALIRDLWVASIR